MGLVAPKIVLSSTKATWYTATPTPGVERPFGMVNAAPRNHCCKATCSRCRESDSKSEDAESGMSPTVGN